MFGGVIKVDKVDSDESADHLNVQQPPAGGYSK